MQFIGLHIATNLLLLFSAFWSFSLIRTAKGRSAWIAFSVGFAALSALKLFELISMISYPQNESLFQFNLWFDLFASALIAVAIIFVGQVFVTMDREEENRMESEQKFKTLFNNSNDQVYVIDLYGNFVEINQVCIDVLGYSKEQFMSMHIARIKSHKHAENIEELMRKIKVEGKLIYESEHVSKNGRIIPVEVNSRLIDYSNGKAVLSMARDITERKQTERKILNAIIETEEKEKERFAKDLHDGLGTLLSSINIYISLLKSGKVDDAQRENLFDYTKALIDEAVMNAKEIANNLRPNVISRFGLAAALKSLCEKINNTGVLKINFNTKNFNADFLNKDSEVTLYRVANELINNTLKHASADTVDIEITSENRNLWLSYKDNGKGFNVEETINNKSGKGMGLANIVSRINAINGILKIKSAAESGTEVRIDIKL